MLTRIRPSKLAMLDKVVPQRILISHLGQVSTPGMVQVKVEAGTSPDQQWMGLSSRYLNFLSSHRM